MNFFQIFGFGKQKPMKPGDFTSEEAKYSDAWLKTVNPLRGMTAQRMQNLYDASRSGDTVHLQWLYHEIEQIDPTLMICQQRRTGALASLDWHIATRNERRTRRFDPKLAEEQSAALEMAFGEADQANFNDAVEHLARAFFRGFSHVLPRWSDDGLSLLGFDCLDQWNFVRDLTTGIWYWNPEANTYTTYDRCRPIPEGELVTFVAPYHIDYPAMTIYLRSAVGEKGWAKFVERFGIPPVILTMPSDIPNDQVSVWRASAEKVAEGGSGAVPNGTGVNFCDSARGINPFKDFVHNQRELIVLMATGGLLTSLTEAGSGTLAGGAHADTWAEIRRMDSAKIGSVINRTLADAILDRAFPGLPHLVYFAFDTEAVPSPGEVFDDAIKSRQAGYLIEQSDLEERTGYKLVKEETPMAGAPATAPQLRASSAIGNREDRGKGAPAIAPSRSEGILAAFSKDTGPAADAIKELLKDPSPERAKALLADLPKLLPEDPALAAVIADEMARAFGGEKTKGEGEGQVKNAISNPCPKCHRQMSKQGTCTHCEKVSANKAVVEGLIADLDKVTSEGGKAWKNTPKELGEVDDKLAADIKKANPDMKATVGTIQTIDQDQLRHAIMEHGEGREKLPSNVPITKDDLKRIPDVINDYDKIVRGKGIKDGKKQEGVVFRKKFKDGTVCCVEIDWYRRGDKRHELKFQTMWKERGEVK